MEKEFEYLEHTADIGILAYGVDLPQVFINAARGLFSLIAEMDNIAENEMRNIEVSAPDRESLLVEWLNELIFLFDVENIIFKKFEILDFSDTGLKARAYGEKVDKSRHQIKTGVKATTYHQLKIEEKDGYTARVIFDV